MESSQINKLIPRDPCSIHIKHHRDIVVKILTAYLSKLELEMLDDTSITYTMVRMTTVATAVTRMMFWGDGDIVECRHSIKHKMLK